MLRVRETPAVEGNKQERVHDKTHGVVEVFRLGEGAVAALVCEDPDAGEDEALHGGVGCPGGEAEVGVGEEGDVGHGQVDEDGEVEVVADDVGHGAEDGGLEAPGWDGVVDFLHGEGGEFEDIAVEVEMGQLFCWDGGLRGRSSCWCRTGSWRSHDGLAGW